MSKENLKRKITPHKTNHGITLIALIITIVVMLILVAVTLAIALGENGVVNSAKEAKEKQALAQMEEKILIHFSVDYYNMMSEQYNKGKALDESTVGEMAQICIDTGISPEKLTVHYSLYNAKANETNGNNELKEEFILYRMDKVTEEEKIILEEKGIEPLIGDVTLDGYLTKVDAEEIEKNVVYKELSESELEMWDLNSDYCVDVLDSPLIYDICNGILSYEGGYII